MEKDKKQILHGDCPRKLNLTAPLLLTKRHLSVNIDNNMLENSKDSSSRVPFSWERVPGQPKDTSDDDIDIPPTPRPPPNRWKPQANTVPLHVDGQFSDHDNGCDGDDDGGGDDEEYGGKERFSDTIDIFSLGESVDDLEGNYRATRNGSSTTLEHINDWPLPNFIIQRFLQDAQALATASVANKKVSFSSYPYSDDHSFSRDICIGRSHSSPKGCGLGNFFPWRVKPKICSAKTAVCDSIIGATQKQD